MRQGPVNTLNGAVEALNLGNDQPLQIAALADLVIATVGRGANAAVVIVTR